MDVFRNGFNFTYVFPGKYGVLSGVWRGLHYCRPYSDMHSFAGDAISNPISVLGIRIRLQRILRIHKTRNYFCIFRMY